MNMEHYLLENYQKIISYYYILFLNQKQKKMAIEKKVIKNVKY